MIKIIFTTLALMATSALADSTDVPRWAQEKKPVEISYYLGLGRSFHLESTSAGKKSYHQLFGRMDFSISPKMNIWIGGEYNIHSLLKFWTIGHINFTGDFKIKVGKLSQKVNPYFVVGLGGSYIKLLNSNSGRTSTGGGIFEFGSGIESKKMFFQACFISVSTGKESWSYIPVTVGVKI